MWAGAWYEQGKGIEREKTAGDVGLVIFLRLRRCKLRLKSYIARRQSEERTQV